MLQHGAYIAHLSSWMNIIVKYYLKGVILVPEQGYLEILAYTSNAQIPLENVAITVTSGDGTALAMRLTDRNGIINSIPIPVPDISNSLHPNPSDAPFTPVNVYARLEGFEQEENKSVQIFPNVITRLNLEMIPLSELPSSWDKAVVFNTPPQNL